MMHIFLPYFERAGKWEELRYALRSWAKFAQFPYQIVIVGDLPHWCQNVIHLPHTPKHDGKEGEILRDAIDKMNLFLGWAKLRNIQPFIRTYDDIFLLKQVEIKDISIPKAVYDMTKLMPNKTNTWRKQLWNTYSAMRAEGCHGWNCESHTPEAFITDYMSQIIERYQLPKAQLLTGSLYYNELVKGSKLEPIILEKSDKWKAGFYGSNDKYSFGPSDNVEEICNRKMFLNFDDAGLNAAIKTFLEKEFPTPSRHEI